MGTQIQARNCTKEGTFMDTREGASKRERDINVDSEELTKTIQFHSQNKEGVCQTFPNVVPPHH